jgi:hypothetical protein
LDWKAQFKIGVKSSKENKISGLLTSTKEEMEKFGWGRINFLSHEEFFDPTNEYFKDGKFTIICEVNSYLCVVCLIKH